MIEKEVLNIASSIIGLSVGKLTKRGKQKLKAWAGQSPQPEQKLEKLLDQNNLREMLELYHSINAEKGWKRLQRSINNAETQLTDNDHFKIHSDFNFLTDSYQVMPKKVTTYNLFIAAPADAMKMVKPLIIELVAEWNRIQGEQNGIQIAVKDWESHSFPQYGKRPQAFINNQVLSQADIVVAAFWTRFGQSTGKAGSATEEELIRAHHRRLPIMLYFADHPVNPSELNSSQYKRVLKFKKANKDKALYRVFSSEDEFRRLFRLHLSDTMVFLRKKTARTKRRRRSKN